MVTITPPSGAEFGKTEVFYCSVKAANSNRATRLVDTLCSNLEKRLQELRHQRAESMVAELAESVSLATASLGHEVDRLKTIEKTAGADLSELRHLVSSIGGTSQLQQKISTLESELRRNAKVNRASNQLLTVLQTIRNNPKELLITPKELLVSQPALRQLKQSLTTAQVQLSSLRSSRSAKHPNVISAQSAYNALQQSLRHELRAAEQSIALEIDLQEAQQNALQTEIASTHNRLSNLATHRADYAMVLATVAEHTRLTETAQKRFADGQAKQAAALTASLVNRIDAPEAGVKPLGLGRVKQTAAAGMGGLLFGLGMLFLVANPKEEVKSRVVVQESSTYANHVKPKVTNNKPVAASFDTVGLRSRQKQMS